MTTIDHPTGDAPDTNISRRSFLGGAGAGLAVAFTIGGGSGTLASLIGAEAAGAATQTPLTGWVKVGSDGTVTIAFGGCEMGQGALTGLAQAAAEELMVPWSVVRTEYAPIAQTYTTGGSTAIRNGFAPMRLAGAQAREMLIAEAASRWGVPTTQCKAVNGTVQDTVSLATLTYAALAAGAATRTPPANPPLTPAASFRIIGKNVARLDLPAKVTGKAVYGIDVRVPGMVYAAIVNSPVLGGKLVGTPAVPSGATAVVPLGDAVAVVSTNTWAAMRAARSLKATWTTPADAASNTTATMQAQAATLLGSGTPIVAQAVGDPLAALPGSAKQIDATYSLPYLAHAYMEVLNCTVSITAAGCEVWAPTQAPGWVAQTAASVSGLDISKVTVHQTLLGGGLGRKIEQDYIAQAVGVAKVVKKPVKVMWSREQDMTHDKYRPMAVARVRAGIDATGTIKGWWNRLVTPSILGQRGWIGPGQVDGQAVDGAIELPYAMAARKVEWVPQPTSLPLGFWRSVGHSLNCFVVESAIDELALAAGLDPLAYRRKLLAGNTRALKVLNTAATLGGWGTALPAGHARGIAFSQSFGSLTAEVVEVSAATATSLRVHQVAVAIDCGTAVNPGQVVAQMEGGVIHALNAALWGRITFTNGKVNETNFNKYKMMRLRESPTIKVSVIQSGQPIGGVGEPGVPPLAAALANAHAALTKTRIRTLPFFPGATMGDI